jgi:ApaG protein
MQHSSYEKTTADIRVTVEPAYLESQSRPEERHYVWSYRVRIHNGSHETVQLHSRYWRITDSSGAVQEVEGEGVVGKQPVLQPGESFEYSSGTPLNTPGGMMIGRYTMQRQNGENFAVDIPAFSLDSPYESAVRH